MADEIRVAADRGERWVRCLVGQRGGALWEDPTLGDDANADGRALLHQLTARNLWLQHRHEQEDTGSA